MDPKRRATLLRTGLFSLLGLAMLLLGYRLRRVLNPLLFAALLAYILNPLVDAISRRAGVSRFLGVAAVFVAFFLAVALAIAWAVPRVAAQVEAAAEEAPRLGEKAVRWIERSGLLDSRALEELRAKARTEWPTWVRSVPSHAAAALRAAASSIQGLLGFLGFCLLVPVYLFFLLLEWPKMEAWAHDLLPIAGRERLLAVLREIDRATAAFFRGRLLVGLAKGVLTGIGFAIAGAPYPLLFGLLAAVSSLVPFLNAFVVLLPSVLLGALQANSALLGAIAPAAVFAAVEVVESFGINPFYLGRQVSLHPLALFVVIFVGGDLLGFFGMIVAVPLACAAKILLREFVLPEWRKLAQADAPGAPSSSRSP